MPGSPPRPPLGAQLRSLGPTYYTASVIFIFERLAYYGLRTVIPIYMVLSRARGGPEFDHEQKGTIFFFWALIASFTPMLTGGYADRYGYRRVIALACAIDVLAYLLLAHTTSYPLFFAGCVLLAAGTGLFRPGIEGLLAHTVPRESASMAWGLFYMLINIGGLLGPVLASALRANAWRWVFYACAATVALNSLLLLRLKEPPRQEGALSLHRHPPLQVLRGAILHLLSPRLLFFVVIMSAFWLMYNQVFDILPNVIEDWVDSAPLLEWLGNTLHISSWAQKGRAGGQIPQELLININGVVIVLFMVPVAFLTRLLPPLLSIVLGIFVAVLGTLLLGSSTAGAMVVLGIVVFSFGEMAASPKLKEYMAGIAPPHQRGLYMGYSEVPNGIGWAIGDKLSGSLYDKGGDKVNLARRYLVERLHHAKEWVDAIEKDDVMSRLADEATSGSTAAATRLLWDTYHPQTMWLWFAGIGGASILGLLLYQLLLHRLDRRRAAQTSSTPLPAW